MKVNDVIFVGDNITDNVKTKHSINEMFTGKPVSYPYSGYCKVASIHRDHVILNPIHGNDLSGRAWRATNIHYTLKDGEIVLNDTA